MRALPLLFCLVSISAFAHEAKLPFCDNSLSVAPGETGAINDNRNVKFTESVPFELSTSTYAKNRKFFRSLSHNCLQLGVLEILNSGEKFLVYRTNRDECDGGNTFGIITRESSGQKVADINDGDITCK